MQIVHSNKKKEKAIVSLFFELGDDESDFLNNLGFDPSNAQTSTQLQGLSTN